MISELDQYKADGFYVAKGLLDKNSVELVNRSLADTFLDQLAHISAPADSSECFSAMQALHQLDLERYKKTAGALWRKLEVYQLMHDPRITGFLRSKFGWQDMFVPGGQVVLIMAHELKIPGGYFGLDPHQDFPSVQGSLDGVVVWLPLCRVDRDNFPLEVIPGSHRQGLLPMLEHGSAAPEVQPDLYKAGDFIPVEVEAGDVVFMSMFTVHRSSINGKKGQLRVALSTRFDNASEPTFIDRSYPTAYMRTVHREQFQSGFPTQSQVREIFGG